MSTAAGSRRLVAEDFPLGLGGEESVVELPGVALAAHLGLDGEEVFVQPVAGGAPLVCNGSLLKASRWLRPGDLLRLGEHRLRCGEEGGVLCLTFEPRTAADVADDNAADSPAPRLVPPPREGRGGREDGRGPSVVPVPALTYTPPRDLSKRRLELRLPWRSLSLVAVAALLIVPAWFLFTARAVDLRIEPEPDEVRLAGGLLRPRVGDGYLLRPGAYVVHATREGYRPLAEEIEVGAEARQTVTLEMTELPGLLDLETTPKTGATVWIDEAEVGAEPLVGAEVERGERMVRIAAEGYVEHRETVTVEGLGRRQRLSVELVPLWAAVTFRSRPEGARVLVDGVELGATPLTQRVLAGTHRLELRLARHKTGRASFNVEPDTPLTLPRVELELADGGLEIVSRPDAAAVTVGGAYRGTTPLELDLAPGRAHVVVVTKEGFETATQTVELAPEESRELRFELAARLGEIEVEALPAGAELWVNGERAGEANQVVRLVAVPQMLEIRHPGFVTHRATLTPRPGFRQTLSVTLETVEEKARAVAGPVAQVVRTAQGQELRLIRGGELRMGASRREAGRRANEALRTVEITRPFYLATQEVSNRHFREFADGHRSGRVGHVNLETDHHPVVRVSWEDAARYCNWLSARDSLPPFYQRRGGTWVASDPLSTGYRLPLEAEWAWAARYPDGKNALKYPWGDSMPVPAGAGNYADAAAGSLLRATLAGYDDGFPATAPVDSFRPNALGLLNLGGNVAEWVHDLYSLYAGSSSAKERDPMGPGEGEFHVIRGSSWMHDSVTELRLSFRDYGAEPRPDVGFRIARFLEAPK